MLKLALVVLSLGHYHPTQKPYWYAGVPSCPQGYSVYADESRALAGKDSAVCVKEVRQRNAWPDHSDEDSIHSLVGQQQ